MIVALYARVSTADQSIEAQVAELVSAGHTPTCKYEDVGISGKTPAFERPGFVKMVDMFAHADPHIGKHLIVTKVDRLGRSAKDILDTVDRLGTIGVRVFVKQLGDVDLTSSAGKMVLTVLGAVAEMERSLIAERTVAALAVRRAAGKPLGRRHALSDVQRAEVRVALASNSSINGLAKKYGVSRGTIRNCRAPATKQAAA